MRDIKKKQYNIAWRHQNINNNKVKGRKVKNILSSQLID